MRDIGRVFGQYAVAKSQDFPRMFTYVNIVIRLLHQEFVNIIFGIWLAVSPYLLGFQADTVITTGIMGVGILIIALAIWEMFSSARVRR